MRTLSELRSLPNLISISRLALAAGFIVVDRTDARIVLVMLRDASADQFCESVEIGLEANHSEAELERIQPQTQALFAKIRAIGEARKGMRIVLDYSPSAAATTLFVDGAAQGEPMQGAEFFRGLLRIWLGERPAQPDLKRMLLQQSDNEKE